jgi:hypothetical protein
MYHHHHKFEMPQHERERESEKGWVSECEKVSERERGYAQCVTVLIAHKVYMESSFMKENFFFSLTTKKRKFLGVRTFYHHDDSNVR